MCNCAGTPRLARVCPHAFGAWTILILQYQNLVGDRHPSMIEPAELTALPLADVCTTCPRIHARLAQEDRSMPEAFLDVLQSDDLGELMDAIKHRMCDFNFEKQQLFEKTYNRLSATEQQISMPSSQRCLFLACRFYTILPLLCPPFHQ